MTNTKTSDVSATVAQIHALTEAGCQIVRCTVPDMESAKALSEIKKQISIPLVADIHFDYRLAIAAIENGADKICFNPGNIGSDEKVKAVARACSEKNIPIRIGVNSGSVEKSILAKYGSPTAGALTESALYHASLLEKFDFDDIVISIKSSNVKTMMEAYRLVAARCPYPLHLGVTEAGTYTSALIKSSIGIGSLLADGIGDTIRVSMTDSPVREVEAGIGILKVLGLREGPEIISCPTCGRTKIDLISLANQVEKRLAGCKKNVKVAVMGCAVNGPGEAREAEIGIAGGDGEGLIFKKGTIVKKVPESQLFDALKEELDNWGK
jgi:(E)-4-hydroxy-3-methylbut-2-enyl-diphosphate synthase